MTVYSYKNPQTLSFYANSYKNYPSYIESIELYDNATGALLQNEFPAVGRRYYDNVSQPVQFTIPDNVNRANITYVVTYRPISCNPSQPGVSAHNVTVHGTYAADVAANTQTVGYFADTFVDTPSDSYSLADNGTAVFNVGTDTTPTLNLKSDSNVSISAVQVLDAQGNDITVSAFGAAKYYTDFIESCKTSRFGFLELQNITGDVTVNVTYDTPVADGTYKNSNSNAYSVTIITKGDVGPYSKSYALDYKYQDINCGGYTVCENGQIANSTSGNAYNRDGGYHMRDGSQMTRYFYSSGYNFTIDTSNYAYIDHATAYFNDDGTEVPDSAYYAVGNNNYKLSNAIGKKVSASQIIRFTDAIKANNQYRSITVVVTYKELQKTTVYASLTKQHYCYGYSSSANPTALLFNTNDATTAYQTLNFNRITSTNSTSTVYKLQAGVKVKVKNIFNIENRPVEATRPQELIDYVNSRMTFNGIEIYKASNFSHNSNATATLGDAVPFTTETVWDDTYYVFTMPESGVRIIPKYTDHLRAVAVISGDKYNATTNYLVDYNYSNKRGTAALVGDDDNWFISNHWYNANSSYTSTSYSSYNWSGGRMMTLENSTFTLTATPASSDYMVKDIKAYKFSYNGNKQYNGVHYYNGTMTSCSWLSYSNSEITNEDITSSVISNLSDADSNGVRTCTVTIPSGLDVGNIAIYVDFEPAQTITYKHFQYVKDSASNTFNPIVYLKGIFGGSNAGNSSVTATNGVDIETAVYDEDGGYQILTCELGGGSGNESALYNRNMVYTLKNYETDAELVKFRIYRDQILPMGSYISSDLETYLDLANCTITPYSNATYPCETVSLKIKVPSSGAKLCYESQPFYIPVTIKQFTIDKNGTASEATSTDFEVLAEKYYANTDNLSDAVRNRPFTSGASVSDPYTVDTNAQANWTSSFTAAGTPTSRFMEVENGTYYQGIKLTPQMLHLNSYIMADTPITAKGLNDRTGANGVNLTVTANEDEGSYLISFSPYYSYSLNCSGGRSIEICVYYQQTDDYYTNFSYQVDNSLSAFKPRTTLKGRIQGVASGTVEVSNAARTISTPAYDSTVENPYLLTVEIGGAGSNSNSAFYQDNLVYTVKDYSNNAQLLKFRVYRDQIIPLTGYTMSDVAEYIVTSGDDTYSFETVSGYEEVCSKLTMKFKVKRSGLILVCSPEYTYVPVTVKQYKLNSAGAPIQLTASDTDFETTVTKAGGGNNDFGKKKYFYTAGVITDTYGLNAAPDTDFADTYSMSGAADTHYMYLSEITSSGVYVDPVAPDGYTLAAIEGIALNKSGAAIDDYRYRDSYIFNPSGYSNGKGYSIGYSSGTSYLRGAGELVVNIYYQPTTQFKVKQSMDGVLQSQTLGEVEFTNTAVSLPAIPYYAYNNVTDNHTLTAYTESGGDVANDNYEISKSADGSRYVLTINDVVTDKYIFIQLVGKERIYLSNLQLNQQIKLIGSDSYVDCYEGNYGSVTVNGTLDGVENPMNFGSDCSSYTLSDAATAEGSVRSDTALTFSAVPPDDEYVVKDIIVTINGEDISSSVKSSLSEGVYTVGLAPDSGTTVITVRYAIKTTPYTLTYKYNGRKGANDGSYTGDDGENDPMTYTVDVELYPADITIDGKPTQRAIADHAPAVDDIYKDCRWTVTNTDSDTVNYSKEQNEVTVNAVQNAKKYKVEFFYAAGNEEADVVLNNVKLNSLATDNEGEFIQAPEKNGDNNFAYWSVLENGKEIAQCYSRSFNLRVTGNYKIYAMYGERANVMSISDPRYTRQQYTSNGTQVDKLQVDFLLAYMESNGLLLNSELAEEKGYTSGIVVEYFDDCKISKDDIPGGTLTDDDKASVTLPGVSAAAIKAFAESSDKTSTNETQHLMKYTVSNSCYNNKNRVDRVINFSNSEGARHMVFRAYYYVSHVVNGQTVTDLTDPVTFYLYDIGNSQTNASTEEG